MDESLLDKIVVVDSSTKLSFIGKLVKLCNATVRLEQVAIFDSIDSRISFDQYLIECAEIGYSVTRRAIWIDRKQIISMSLLSDVIIP